MHRLRNIMEREMKKSLFGYGTSSKLKHRASILSFPINFSKTAQLHRRDPYYTFWKSRDLPSYRVLEDSLDEVDVDRRVNLHLLIHNSGVWEIWHLPKCRKSGRNSYFSIIGT